MDDKSLIVPAARGVFNVKDPLFHLLVAVGINYWLTYPGTAQQVALWGWFASLVFAGICLKRFADNHHDSAKAKADEAAALSTQLQDLNARLVATSDQQARDRADFNERLFKLK